VLAGWHHAWEIKAFFVFTTTPEECAKLGWRYWMSSWSAATATWTAFQRNGGRRKGAAARRVSGRSDRQRDIHSAVDIRAGRTHCFGVSAPAQSTHWWPTIRLLASIASVTIIPPAASTTAADRATLPTQPHRRHFKNTRPIVWAASKLACAGWRIMTLVGPGARFDTAGRQSRPAALWNGLAKSVSVWNSPIACGMAGLPSDRGLCYV